MDRREQAVTDRELASDARDRAMGDLRDANEQLVLATVQADELNERDRASSAARDKYIAMVGHELRSPLSPIMITLDLMELRDPTQFVDERKAIRRQVGNLTRLIEDLVDVARFSTRRVHLKRERADLATIVTAGIDTALSFVNAKGHELAVSLAPNIAVQADPMRLTQAIANLVTNAAKYTPAGGHIRVTSEAVGGNAKIVVTDDGIGIPAELLPHVFDPFVQSPNAVEQAQGGLGLGLAIVQQLITLHGGVVTAASPGPGAGSTFAVQLPTIA